MYRFALLPLAFCLSALAQTVHIASGSTVYIEPMGGYETYLTAALQKKHVPLVIVEDRSKASFVMRGRLRHSQPGQPAVVVNNSNVNNTSDSAFDRGFARGGELADQRAAAKAAMGVSSVSVSVVDPSSSQIVFSYSSAKMGGKQIQQAAEDCAKHLGQFIQKGK